MQLIAPTYFLSVTGHINFNIKILEILAMELIRKYSKEMKIGKILHEARLSTGETWELPVHSLLHMWCVHAYSFFLNGPKTRSKSARCERVLLSVPWAALFIHEQKSECLLRRWGQGKASISRFSILSQCTTTQCELCWSRAPNAIYSRKGADGIIHRLAR